MKSFIKSVLVAGVLLSTSVSFADLIVIERTFGNSDGSIPVNVWIPVSSNAIGPVSSSALKTQALQLSKRKACGEAYHKSAAAVSSETFVYNRGDLSSTGILKVFSVRVSCQYGLDTIAAPTADVSR